MNFFYREAMQKYSRKRVLGTQWCAIAISNGFMRNVVKIEIYLCYIAFIQL